MSRWRSVAPAPRRAILAATLAAAAASLATSAAQAAPVAYSYSVAGTANVKTLFKTAASFSGTAAGRTDPATGAFAADLTLPAFSANLTSQGAVPVTAQVVVSPIGALVGTIGTGGLSATLKARIKLASVSFAGTPIATSSNCQTAQLSIITLKSVSSTFDPAAGGTLAGTFSTSDLTGCNGLSGIVSTATSTLGNSIAITLSAGTARPARYSDQLFPSATVTDGVQYSAPTGPVSTTPQPQLMDIYQPTGDTATQRPAIVWVHGGSFIAGDRKEGLVSELARRFALRGYVTVSIDYRLLATTPCAGANYTQSCSVDALYAARDTIAAVEYLRTHAADLRIDPDRIAVGGDSAGAIASILVGGPHGAATDPARVAGVYSISGGSPTDAIFEPYSAPMFFWHGTADTTVPYQWAVDNTASLTSLGVYNVLHSIPGAGHVPTQYIDDMDSNARDFLYRVMSLQTAQQ